jgi:uncharacterized membrane protein YphA (DoxX/SURF4 family)
MTSKHLPRTIAQMLFGVSWLVFGLNGFLNFIPKPETPMPEPAVALFKGFVESGYMMQLISGTEVFVGVLLVTGLFVPLALTVIAPVLVNIVAFHLFARREGMAIALIFVAFELFLVLLYRQSFRGVLSPRPAESATSAPTG